MEHWGKALDLSRTWSQIWMRKPQSLMTRMMNRANLSMTNMLKNNVQFAFCEGGLKNQHVKGLLQNYGISAGEEVSVVGHVTQFASCETV